MELLKKRPKDVATDTTTIGDFLIDGVLFCHGLEPTDRGLTSEMTLEEIEAIKIHGETAVPAGRYRVVKFYSPKHQTMVPRIMDIPGFDFVEIHVGNTAKDTEGCLLLGYGMAVNEVLHSAAAINDFYPKFFKAIDDGEEVWITFEEAA